MTTDPMFSSAPHDSFKAINDIVSDLSRHWKAKMEASIVSLMESHGIPYEDFLRETRAPTPDLLEDFLLKHGYFGRMVHELDKPLQDRFQLFKLVEDISVTMEPPTFSVEVSDNMPNPCCEPDSRVKDDGSGIDICKFCRGAILDDTPCHVRSRLKRW